MTLHVSLDTLCLLDYSKKHKHTNYPLGKKYSFDLKLPLLPHFSHSFRAKHIETPTDFFYYLSYILNPPQSSLSPLLTTEIVLVKVKIMFVV